MFVRHNHVIINTSKITFITVRESLKSLVIHFDGDSQKTLEFESLEALENFFQYLNEE